MTSKESVQIPVEVQGTVTNEAKNTQPESITWVESQEVTVEESLKSLWNLVTEKPIYKTSHHTYFIHWIQPVGEVADIGIMIDNQFHDNTVLALDRIYSVELIADIFDWQLIEDTTEKS